ncbi:divergent polysaccharide deacetylase family protein [Marinomonas balearica]|uniref:Divergent polysaccharide deacetylase n=1 Tax=Marinomonas balearica TaxID=491947 RepID=A0A4R6M8V8_9GAMM|nr:divergent polysaccharide deacetylase family protein [Marinomonas balearica]TDO97928.1 hypothetical protein DFP79_1557 [Marinomonas balearica]
MIFFKSVKNRSLNKIAIFIFLASAIFPSYLMAHDTTPERLGPVVSTSNAVSTPQASSVMYPFSGEGLLNEEGKAAKLSSPSIDSLSMDSLSMDSLSMDRVLGPWILPSDSSLHHVNFTAPPSLLGHGKTNAEEDTEVNVESSRQPKISIIIDDVGYNRRGMESSLKLPTEVALAILPHTPFGEKTALKSMEQNRTTLLHAPMENQRELKLGPGGLYVSMSEHEFKSVLRDDLANLPGIKGVNNHMGSLLTTNAQAMNWVMQVLGESNLFFIDSVTSAESVAYTMAQRHSLLASKRDVFLDNVREVNAIDRQFQKLIQLAHKNGQAIAIGHPYPETMAYLLKRLADLNDVSVRLVPIDDMITPPSR